MSIEFQLKIAITCTMIVLVYIGYPLSNMLIKKYKKREGRVSENLLLASMFAFAVAIAALYGYDYIQSLGM